MPDLLVLTLGGTIDAQPYPEAADLYPVNAIPNFDNNAYRALEKLLKANPDFCLRQIPICNKDSKSLSDEDFSHLYQAVKQARANRIIVTMGTDRMVETALWLKHQCAMQKHSLACPVVFTGAIWPLSNKEKSDGLKNLEMAALFHPAAQAGIYIAMHGLFEPPDRIKKDFAAKKFIRIAA